MEVRGMAGIIRWEKGEDEDEDEGREGYRGEIERRI
jgi:hypothetical protein